MDYLLQVAKDAKQPIDDNEVEKVTVAHFESGYTLDGLPILPPLVRIINTIRVVHLFTGPCFHRLR